MTVIRFSRNAGELSCGDHSDPARHPSRHPGDCGSCEDHARGFTLVELLIAVMILSVGIMGVAQVLAVAERHTAHARDETTAINLVQEIREKIMCENFDDVYSIFNGIDTDVPGSVPTVALDWMNHLQTQLGPTGRGTVQITRPDTDADLAFGMRGILVAISWNERGQTISVPMRFAIAKTSP